MASIHELSALAAEEHPEEHPELQPPGLQPPELQPIPCAEVHDAHDERTVRATWSAGCKQAALQQAPTPLVRPSVQPVRHATTAPVHWLVHWLVRSATREVHGSGGECACGIDWSLAWSRDSADDARAAASAALATSTLFTAAWSAARASVSPL